MTSLSLTKASFSYAGGDPVLKEVSLELCPGESLGLMGPMGSGKTTLLLIMAGLLSFEGTLKIHGKIYGEDEQNLIHQKVGLFFQNPDDQLFMPTVYEDIAFGPVQMGLGEEEVQQRVERALRQVGLEGFGDRPPHHLSGGEKKAVALATVLSMDPEILLMDEPSSNLDPYHRRKVIQLVQSLKSTSLIASHDLDFLWETTSRILLIDGGKVVAQGPTQDILSQRELLEAHKLELPLRLQQG